MKRLITKLEVEKWGEGPIVVTDEVIITPAALDLAQEKGIPIIYRKGFASEPPEETPRKARIPSPPGVTAAQLQVPVPPAGASSGPGPSGPRIASNPPVEGNPPVGVTGTQRSNGPPRPPSPVPGAPTPSGTSVIVSAVGRNRTRILSEIATGIADCDGDIQDISQRIIGDYFSMIIIVDISRIKTDFATFKKNLEELGREGDYKLTVQHETVFQSMHRI
jgi:ACT domain-containing protein